MRTYRLYSGSPSAKVIQYDMAEVPDDFYLLDKFLMDLRLYDKQNIISLKKELEDPKEEYVQGDIMSVTKVDNAKVTIEYDIFDDGPTLTLPKSEFLRFLDELAAAIDTGKDIWIEKSDEGKYRIYGE